MAHIDMDNTTEQTGVTVTHDTAGYDNTAWLSDEGGTDETCCYMNAATCPDCGAGMVRLGTCFTCPLCGWGSCG